MERKRESPDRTQLMMKGIPASEGIAIGRAYIYRKPKPVVKEEAIDPVQVERHCGLFDEAKKVLETELNRLKKKEIDHTSLDMIEAQIEMVHDPDLEFRVKNLIREKKCSVDYAILQVLDSYIRIFGQSENEMARERTIDLEDVRDRLIQIANNSSMDLDIEPGSIVIAEDVSPREIIQFSDFNISALVTDHGGQTSHASILARSMGIPSVVGTSRACQIAESSSNIIVDGNEGVVIIDPPEPLLREYEEMMKEEKAKEERLRKVIREPSLTKDGVPFQLRANIEFLEELPNLQKYGAVGIGLLRTESIYIRKEHFEDQDRQFEFYSKILEETGTEPVTIRLFDAGGDKFFSLSSRENNPFLGWRGIRMLLDERDLLREQLRAVLRVAGAFPGRVRILVPMVSVIEEVLEVKKELSAIQEELVELGKPVDESVKIGIMVEVPSVAIKADSFARHVDFFSIGTNDLTQYTLAVDRGNELISGLYQEVNPAVFKLIYSCVKAARKAGIGIVICGEMASYPKAALCLVGMGISDLSMSPAAIPKVKTFLKEHSSKQMEELAAAVLKADTAEEVDNVLKGE